MKTISSVFYNAIYYFSLFVFVTLIPAAQPLYASTDAARAARDAVQVAPPLLEPNMRTTVQIAVINVGRTVRRAGAHRPFPQIPQPPAISSKTDALSSVEGDNAFSAVAPSPSTSASVRSIQIRDGLHRRDTDTLFFRDQANIN